MCLDSFSTERNCIRESYFAGLFRHYKDAQTALKTVHKVGFKDAFIVAYRDGKSIRTSEAQKLEKK